MFLAGKEGANSLRMRALVLAGFATTTTCETAEARTRFQVHSILSRRAGRTLAGISSDSMGACTNLAILGSQLLQSRGLASVDVHILGHNVLALHACLAGEASHHDGNLNILAGLIEIRGCNHTCMHINFDDEI